MFTMLSNIFDGVHCKNSYWQKVVRKKISIPPQISDKVLNVGYYFHARFIYETFLFQ